VELTPLTSPLRDKFHPEILTGSPDQGVKKTRYFIALYVNIL